MCKPSMMWPGRLSKANTSSCFALLFVTAALLFPVLASPESAPAADAAHGELSTRSEPLKEESVVSAAAEAASGDVVVLGERPEPPAARRNSLFSPHVPLGVAALLAFVLVAMYSLYLKLPKTDGKGVGYTYRAHTNRTLESRSRLALLAMRCTGESNSAALFVSASWPFIALPLDSEYPLPPTT